MGDEREIRCKGLLPRLRVVLVDDDDAVRAMLRLSLRSRGFDIVGEASDGQTALALCHQVRPGAVVSDYRMPGMTGDEVLAAVARAQPAVVGVLCTAEPAAVAPGSGAGVLITVRKGGERWLDELTTRLRDAARRAGPATWPGWERRRHPRQPPTDP